MSFLTQFSKVLEKTYTDKLNIARFMEVTNTDGTTGSKLSEQPVYTDIPCKISFASSDRSDGATEEKNPENLQLKIFCNPDVDIRKGDTLTAIRLAEDGVTELKQYTGVANLPAQYLTHKETLMVQVGEA